jgi:hypothetical protein
VKLVPNVDDLDTSTEHDISPEAVAKRRHSSLLGPRDDASCVKDLLKHHSQKVYQFRADDYSAQIDGNPSFGMLVSTWELTPKAWDIHDFHRFPSVLNGRQGKKYTVCTLRCTCMECSERNPIELVCEPYVFGTARGLWPQVSACSRWQQYTIPRPPKTNTMAQILVHKLSNDLENRVIVLGGESEPGTYLIWGTHPTLQNAMAYNQNIVLKQVDSQEAELSRPSRSREHAKKRRAPTPIALHEPHREAQPQKRPRNDPFLPRTFSFPRELAIRSVSVTSDASSMYPLKIEDTWNTRDEYTHLHSDLINFSPNTGPARTGTDGLTGRSGLPAGTRTPLQLQNIRGDHEQDLLGSTTPFAKTPLVPQKASSRAQQPAATRSGPMLSDSAHLSQNQPPTSHHQQHPLAPSQPQQPVQHDLQQAYLVIRAHVIKQKDQATGLSIMFSNPALLDYMKSVEAAAERNDAYLFRTMREMVDEELVGTGFPRLLTM